MSKSKVKKNKKSKNKKDKYSIKPGGLINGPVAAVNQIRPIYYDWAWQYYIDACANHWMPTEVSMQKDIEQWHNSEYLSDDEKLVFKRCLGFFAGSESLVANNLLLNVMRWVTNPECRQYIGRQNFEELIHNHTVVYICDSLNLDELELYEAYNNIPSIKAKDDFLMQITTDITRQDFNTSSILGIQELLRNIITYYIICEGIMFYSGFAMLLHFKRQNKMVGVGQQIEYTLRDECVARGTELLTKTGWKKVEDISYNDKIAQYTEDGTIEFVNPLRISKSFCDTVYHYQNKENSVSLTVSPNHRMIYLDAKSNKITEKKAQSFNHHPYSKHIVSGKINNNATVKNTLSDYERLMIAIQADSNINNYGYHNGNRCGYLKVSFNLTKERKKQRLRALLDRLSLEYNCNDNVYCVDVPLKYCHKYLKDWVNFNDVSFNWCKEFIEEIKEWDGWVRSDTGSFGYGSTIKSNIDIVQSVATLCGYKTNVYMSIDKRKETYKNYYRMSIIEGETRSGSSITKEEVKYNDFVFGVEVPSGMIVVRENYCVSITGNSLHIKFGVDLINTLKKENPKAWTKDFQEKTISHIKKAVELEIAYAEDVLPRGILGLNSGMFVEYVQHIANRRLHAIGLDFKYEKDKNPFPWLLETIDLKKVNNFFESRVTEYQSGKDLSFGDFDDDGDEDIF